MHFTHQSVANRIYATPHWHKGHACLALAGLLVATVPLMAQTILPPTLSATFNPATISPGGHTDLIFTITNPNSSVSLTDVGGFSDDLSPLNMVSLGIELGSGCTGSNGPSPARTATAGSSTITFGSFTSFGAGNTCSVPYITVLSVDATLGAQTTTTSAITSTNGGTGNTASATITVVAPVAPQLTARFDDASILQFGTTYLRLALINPNNGTLTGVAFTDPLPTGLTIVGAGVQCSQGTLNTGTTSFNLIAEPGSSLISVSDGILVATNPCSIIVGVEGVGLGLQTNTTSVITSTNGGTGNSATASINIIDQIFEDGFEQN